MTNRRWIIAVCTFALLCGGIVLFLHAAATPAAVATVYSDGTKVMELPLDVDAQYRVTCGDGWNLIRVEDGRIRVVAASCRTQDCVRHGAADGGAPIVCLPNRLVITFSGGSGLDAIVG